MTRQNPIEYLRNKEKRLYGAIFRVKPEGFFYVVKGVEIPADEFEALFPLSSKLQTHGNRWKGDNPDGTKKWME